MIKKYLKKDIYLQKKDSTNENDKEIPKEIPKERYISPEERQKTIHNLR